MFQGFRVLFDFQAVDQLLDIVAMRRVEHQHGVLCRDDDDVIDADDRGQMIIGADVNVRGVHDDAAAPDRIALDVAFGQLPDRLPIADIRPADVGGDDCGLAGALHDCVVDRFLRRLGEGLRVEDEEV